MFIHWRDLKGAERRGAVVSTVDLAPTLLDLLGVAELPTAQGRSLRRASAPQPVFAEWRDFRLLGDHEPRPGDFLVSVQDGQHKLIRDLLFPASSLCFDLAVDPNETNNIYGEDHPLTNELGALLDGHLKNGLPHGLAGIDDIQIDEKSLEMLRSLGYVR
jgi:arylsulfatase A-like enzyme